MTTLYVPERHIAPRMAAALTAQQQRSLNQANGLVNTVKTTTMDPYASKFGVFNGYVPKPGLDPQYAHPVLSEGDLPLAPVGWSWTEIMNDPKTAYMWTLRKVAAAPTIPVPAAAPVVSPFEEMLRPALPSIGPVTTPYGPALPTSIKDQASVLFQTIEEQAKAALTPVSQLAPTGARDGGGTATDEKIPSWVTPVAIGVGVLGVGTTVAAALGAFKKKGR